MSDLASQPETSETALTLAERRANYEAWLQSGRRTAMPAHTIRTDEGPGDPILVARREQAHAEADSAASLLRPSEPGCIVRTDEGEGETPDNEEIRLKLAGALASKMEGVDAETATRMANAGNALLAPLQARADDAKADNDKAADDENVKNRVLNQGKGGVAGADEAPSLATVMDAISGISKRLDAIEGRKDNDDPPDEGKSKGSRAADDDDTVRDDGFKWRQKQDKLGTVICSPDTQDAFALVQSRADKVYSANGQQADKPLYGETLSAYRRRLLKPLQKYSDHFKNSDLRVVAVDPAAFMAVEDSIYKSATDAAKDPRTVPLGFLREHVEQRGGHAYTTFTGRPISWMSQFAPSGRRVKRVNQHTPGGHSRVLYGSP